jgi:hypothetical protein
MDPTNEKERMLHAAGLLEESKDKNKGWEKNPAYKEMDKFFKQLMKVHDMSQKSLNSGVAGNYINSTEPDLSAIRNEKVFKPLMKAVQGMSTLIGVVAFELSTGKIAPARK